MCGLSFSGKSTVAARLGELLPGRVVSLDLINSERGLQGGQGIPIEEWAHTNRIAHQRAEQILSRGEHVVVDDTGSPKFIRDGWSDLAKSSCTPFAVVWVQIEPKLQQERLRANRADKRRPDVVDAVLDDHVAQFEPPVDESPLMIDASRTRDEATIVALAEAIRGLTTVI